MEIVFYNRFLLGNSRVRGFVQDVKKRRGYGSSSDSRYDDGRGPPGNPPRRMGRINHLRGPNPPPM
ncbi:hypothetical protein E2I00_011416, partial [Balaenoptera physalus]